MILGQLCIALVAILHIGFLVLEMFLWDKPLGMKVFANTAQKAQLTKVLAQNQGLYNGFLAAGLIWSICTTGAFALALANFFLGCVVVAGVYGAITVSKKILYVQAVPALIALLVVNVMA
jgi:putative membrane protein